MLLTLTSLQNPSPYNPVASDSETTDCESDCGAHTMNGGVRKKKTYHVKNQVSVLFVH